ncbi:hypothetical protein M441DRAFT_245511 [Trichoderma asperellum CBS 433.97]|uniref:Uncharacterized protein n=1 Tax=Trichoderma asperellum (strain ATCC 204424 / CBS 433.97 / NBRC 101777) TaxID=1042311 RepID=A0A2T3YZQ5_TRIA4|nr:hypothetical protein M441DRAFT_245511 [Trichoderma asperellum CBS 433.97]PTB38033.1 hypothetical protein M441DRAFT_245511 [Trichoderma asperellum CBS 433.97]
MTGRSSLLRWCYQLLSCRWVVGRVQVRRHTKCTLGSMLLSRGRPKRAQIADISLLTRVIGIELLEGEQHTPVYGTCTRQYGVPSLQCCEIGMQCWHAVHSWRLVFSGPEAVLAQAPCLFRSLLPLSVFPFACILHCLFPPG